MRRRVECRVGWPAVSPSIRGSAVSKASLATKVLPSRPYFCSPRPLVVRAQPGHRRRGCISTNFWGCSRVVCRGQSVLTAYSAFSLVTKESHGGGR